MNRRNFIQKSSLSTAGILSAASLPAYFKQEKLRVGVIGCGWYGGVLIESALKVGGVQIVSICDVDTKHLKETADTVEGLQGTRPKLYKEYTELLEKDNLQAIFLATPPQWHALPFIAACEKGFDIYCEKPVAYDVHEGLAMIKAAKKAGNVVQIGFQQRSNVIKEKVRSLIKEGRLGKILQIEAHIHYNPVFKDHTVQDPPPSLDWEAWCGPAPKLPYRPNIGHLSWRLEKEYGNGHLVDWGIHYVDFIRKIMDFRTPVTAFATGGLLAHEGIITTPDTLQARMDFDSCPIIWNHRMWGTGELNREFNSGYTFFGEEATMFGDFKRLIIQPKEKESKQEVIEMPTRGVRELCMGNFLEVVKTRDTSQLMCSIEDGFESTTSVQLAMISYYTDSKIAWNHKKKEIPENEQASKLLSRPYRGKYVKPDAF